MFIRLAYDIQFEIPATVAMVALLNVHSPRAHDLLEPDELNIEPNIPITSYIDNFGNRCARSSLPKANCASAAPRSSASQATRTPSISQPAESAVGDLPHQVLSYLLNSRYCEVDRFSNIAFELFGNLDPGWSRVQYICNWVHNHVAFNYQQARPTKTALDVFTERVGVCRDFQHLAVTFCRALKFPPATHRLSRRHRRSRRPSHGLQRLVRGLARRSMVDIRCPQQPAPHRPRPHGGAAATPPMSPSPLHSARLTSATSPSSPKEESATPSNPNYFSPE